MDDDFNMPLALANMFELVNFTNKNINNKGIVIAAKKALLDLAGVFGLDLIPKNEGLSATVETLIKERDLARANKDYKRSDEIRKQLTDMGLILEDTKDGTTWRKKG